MRYIPHDNGPYESGLTARLLYDTVDGLVRKEIINKGTVREDVSRARARSSVYPLSKLWYKPEIRSQIEEFVDSYLFTDLKEPLHGFAEIFQESDPRKASVGLMGYVGRLRQERGVEYNAIGEVIRLIRELKKRADVIFSERSKIKTLDGLFLIKGNAQDAFGQLIIPLYHRVQRAMSELGL